MSPKYEIYKTILNKDTILLAADNHLIHTCFMSDVLSWLYILFHISKMKALLLNSTVNLPLYTLSHISQMKALH